jgi:hypothetical protein
MRILAALALATAALAVPTAAWAYGSEVNVYGCYASGGQVTRPAGTEIVVRQSLTFHYVGAVTHRIYDGVSFSGPGTQIDSTCTVTGA